MLIKSSHEEMCEALQDLPNHGADSSPVLLPLWWRRVPYASTKL